MGGSTHRLIVGVDFGTTFSGVAYIDTAKPNDIISITKWPGNPGEFQKVPSEICYTSGGEVSKWGYEIKDGDERLVWFKLLLDPTRHSITRSSVLARTVELAPAVLRAKEPVDVVADYLSCLRKHTLDTLQKTYGRALLETTPIDYNLTVPAIWSDAAKVLTLRAAEAAGFGSGGKIELISEIEATACSLLRDIRPVILKAHDVFVVVDCGGGIVDVTSYEVVTVKPTLTLKEYPAVSGVLCGSIFLNQRFEDLVRSRTGEHYFDTMKTRPRNRILKNFEQSLKRSFTNSAEGEEFWCEVNGLPDNPAMGIEDGELTLSNEDMLGIFDPIINQILSLVQEQIDMVETQDQEKSRISAVLLAGGFGSSKYLLERLQNGLRKGEGPNKSPPEILHPTNAWNAVARGAAYGIHITSRRLEARKYYGIEFNDNFKFGKHPTGNLIICALTAKKLCTNCIKWYISYGDKVSENTPIALSFIRSVPIDDNMIFTEYLYGCETITAPEYSNHTDDDTVRKLCTVVSDLSGVPKTWLRRVSPPLGEPYYEVNYSLVMTIQSATIAFHVEYNGRKYGDAEVKFLHSFNVMNS